MGSQEAVMTHATQAIIETARASLWRWAEFAEQYWWDSPHRPGLGCFGTGFDSWGVQTNQKYLAAMAILAADDAEPTGVKVSRAHAQERALAALRYSLATHCSGDYQRTDGTQWGHTWISGLGVERMMHGIEHLKAHFTDDDHAGLKRMLCSEADWLVTDYHRGQDKGVHANRWAKEGGNDPESNIWNGAICARAALEYPDHPHATQWTERAHLFFLNSISVPADAQDDTVVAGKPVREWHAGANFFPHYALDHHMYLNVGYMVICLSNIAMLHYTYALRGCEAPESLYWHAQDLWGLVRRLLFSDGRLLRMGGDSRIRYCYCQDYVIPMLILAADLWQDPHALDLLQGAVHQAVREQAFNQDGRYLCHRVQTMVDRAPYYYCRIESDKAVVLSQAMDWLRQRDIAPRPATQDYEASVAGHWEEQEHGAVFHRSATRFASWSWRACENPQGLCLPPTDGDLAEWQENLSGRIHSLDRDAKRWLRDHSIASFDGGFLTMGAFIDRSTPDIREGYHEEETAFHQIAFAALPDDHTVIRLEHATLEPRRLYLRGWEGVKLEIPNDVFNESTRTYISAKGARTVKGHLGKPQVMDLFSRWVNLDAAIGLIGIYGADSWQILQRGERIGGHALGNILCDTLCWQLETEPRDIYGPTVVLDNGTAILASVTPVTTKDLSETGVKSIACTGDNTDAFRAVQVRGQDGRAYVLIANFGSESAGVTLSGVVGSGQDLVSGQSLDLGAAMTLAAGAARLVVRVAR